MGFGILFLGYFLALPTVAGFYYTMIPSAVMLAIACRKLARVNVPFVRGYYLALAIIPFAITASILRLISATVFLAPYFEAATTALFLVWHLFTLTGIEWVAQETGLHKLRVKAFRNKIFSCIYLLPAIGFTLSSAVGSKIPTGAQDFYRGLYIAIILVGIVVLILNLILIYSAYARICMPNDRDMPRKPSRFEFINRRREKEDAREAENAAALEAMKERRRQRLEEKKKKRK